MSEGGLLMLISSHCGGVNVRKIAGLNGDAIIATQVQWVHSRRDGGSDDSLSNATRLGVQRTVIHLIVHGIEAPWIFLHRHNTTFYLTADQNDSRC